MATEKQTRNVPQLSKDVRRLNSLRLKRAKVDALDAEIAALETELAAQLGLPAQISTSDTAFLE